MASPAVFDIRGARGLVDEALAESLCAPISTEGRTDFTQVVLSTRSITPEAAPVFVRELSKLRALRVANLSDIMSGIPEERAMEMLRVLSGAFEGMAIEELDVSDNALGWKGINACQSLFRGRPELRRVRFCNDGLSAAACRYIAELLLPADATAPCPLEQLHFFNNMSGGEGAAHVAALVARCPQLRDFRLASTRCDPEGAEPLCRALASLTSLVSVDLSDNTFGPDCGDLLAAMIRSNRGLERLILADISLEEAGIVAVAEALAEAGANVRVLSLSTNEAGVAGALAIARALRAMPRLEQLSVDENELTSRGAKAIARALWGSKALRSLSMGTNEIGARGAAVVAAAAASCPALSTLDLNGNVIPSEALDEAAGKADALQSVDENDEDGEEEDADDEEQEEDAQWQEPPAGGAGDQGGLEAALAAMSIAE